MGIEMKPVIRDDRDGKDLPENTKPIDLTYNGVKFSLYLSEKNLSELENVIDDFTKHAAPVKSQTTGRKSQQRRSTEEVDAIRQWGRENGWDVKDRGQLSKALVSAYEAR